MVIAEASSCVRNEGVRYSLVLPVRPMLYSGGTRSWGKLGETPDQARRRPGARVSGLDQALADRVTDQAGDIVHVQFLHHARAVELGGLGRDREQRGDLFRRLSLGDELHDLALPGL